MEGKSREDGVSRGGVLAVGMDASAYRDVCKGSRRYMCA